MACFLQSYAAALAERVPRFPVSEWGYVDIPDRPEHCQVGAAPKEIPRTRSELAGYVDVSI